MAAQANDWRNRIVEHGQEAPDQLLANPFNARIHPKAQQDALQGLLDSVGWVAPVIVNRLTGHVIDGHLRVSLALSQGTEFVPVNYVELTVSEEKTILAAFDFITSMAVYDRDTLGVLLSDINSDNAEIQTLLAKLAVSQGVIPPDDPYAEWVGMPEFDQPGNDFKFSLRVNFETEADMQAFAVLIGQAVTPKTDSIIYPKQGRHARGGYAGVDDES